MVSYLTLLKHAGKDAYSLYCVFCGNETPSVGELGICSYCESLISLRKYQVKARNSELVTNLDYVSNLMERNQFEDAFAIFGQIQGGEDQPSYLYVQALFNIRYSNYELSRIRYDIPGFMDENAMHRDKAARLISASKRLLAKSIKMLRDEYASSKSVNTLYALLLSQMKLGLNRGAFTTLRELSKTNAPVTYNYGLIAFYVANEDYKNALRVADSFIKSGIFIPGIYYYIGYSLMKEGKSSDAKRILKEVEPMIRSSNAAQLLAKIS